MNKRIILTAALLGLLAVILGAFGAHGLRDKISDSNLKTWETAVDYHFYHTLALLFLSKFSRAKDGLIMLSYIAFTAGIVLFSGSLYLLATRELSHIGWVSVLGPVTPIGGLFFIIGWGSLFFAALKNK